MIALTRIAGTGTSGDPFRPLNTDDLASLWSMIDLRPPGESEGWCLFGGEEVPQAALVLGDPQERSQAAVNILRNRLGVDLDSRTLGEEILSLLIEPKGWRPLRPAGRKYEVWLGGELVAQMPVVSGGAVFASDDFNRADGLLGSDWPVTAGSQTIVSNEYHAEDGVALHLVKAPALDYYAKVDFVGRPDTFQPTIGTVVRVDYDTSNEAYYGTWRSTGRAEILRIDGDLTSLGVPSFALLANQLYSTSESLPRTLETSAIGSTIRLRILTSAGGEEVNLSATDTTYPDNRGHGVYSLDNIYTAVLDDYEAGDFTRWHVGYVGAG